MGRVVRCLFSKNAILVAWVLAASVSCSTTSPGSVTPGEAPPEPFVVAMQAYQHALVEDTLAERCVEIAGFLNA